MKYIPIGIAVIVWIVFIFIVYRLCKNAMTDQLPDPPEYICLFETHGWKTCACEQCFLRGMGRE